jgi:Ca-activated chloride channel family protein
MMKKLFFLLSVLMIGITSYTYAQGLFGPNHNATMRNGNLDYKKGKYEDAIIKYNKVFKSKQNDPVLNYNLGTILYKKGNFDTAAYFFDNAIKYVKDPILKSKAYYNMGNAYMKSKKYDKATESYTNALKYNPADPDSRYNLSYALRNLKKQQQKKPKDQPKDNPPPDQNKKDQKMDQNKAQELIKSLNNKEQEQNKKIKGQGGNIKGKDW